MASKSERLARLLRELRGDLSQREFAKKLGVTHSAIQSWEAGVAWPGTSNLKKLADLKGYTLDRLQAFLEGELIEAFGADVEPELTMAQILSAVRSLSFEGAAKVVQVATERMLAIRGS